MSADTEPAADRRLEKTRAAIVVAFLDEMATGSLNLVTGPSGGGHLTEVSAIRQASVAQMSAKCGLFLYWTS